MGEGIHRTRYLAFVVCVANCVTWLSISQSRSARQCRGRRSIPWMLLASRLRGLSYHEGSCECADQGADRYTDQPPLESVGSQRTDGLLRAGQSSDLVASVAFHCCEFPGAG